LLLRAGVNYSQRLATLDVRHLKGHVLKKTPLLRLETKPLPSIILPSEISLWIHNG